MTDHESFLLLAAKQLHEGLAASEEGQLGEHLATCSSCRSLTAGMRRDDILLRGSLAAVGVSPRVRRRVLEEASGPRRSHVRMILALAATLLVAAIGVPMIAGGRPPAVPSPPVVTSAPSLAPSPSVPPTAAVASEGPSTSDSVPPSPSPESRPFVAGAYVYNESAPRRDAISAHSEGVPKGEWSRTVPATGPGVSFGGPITCLVIDGADAWMAGPATTATDGSTDRSAFIHVHDGGPNGEGDMAILWMNNRGQTLTTMEGWCENRYIPGGPFPLISGDLVVDDGGG
jgi:hypothetical protein